MKKYFYEKNQYLLNHKVNVRFEEILDMSEEDFRQWCIDLRDAITYIWDTYDCPPRVGSSEKEMIKQFNDLYTFQWHKRKKQIIKETVRNLSGEEIEIEKTETSLVHEMEKIDESTNEKNCIHNTHVGSLGNCVNQFFPTMMKTKIKYNMSSDGKAIYEFFADPNLQETFIRHSKRHFKKDSFFISSKTVLSCNKQDFLISAKTGKEWIETFLEEFKNKETHDFWIKPTEEDETYTGWRPDLYSPDKKLFVTKDEILELKKNNKLSKRNLTHFDESVNLYSIALFQLNKKLFPKYFSIFGAGYDTQFAVNFPPLTAKYLYEKFTEDIKEQDVINIWDPSSGWGGRIAGAMCVSGDRKIHYIGTDPNKDHWIPELNKTKYEYLADFINEHTRKTNLWHSPNTYDIYQEGSEVVQYNPQFQKYKGKLDLVFTSPPYFAKELYSFDEGQSHVKFTQYDEWRDGFLYETLKTAVDWLRPNRYLLWNIADVHFGKDFLPLETDSNRFLKELGMTYVTTLKMVMAMMPGKGRVNEDGTPVFKNSCMIKGQWRKYEPISVWIKK